MVRQRLTGLVAVITVIAALVALVVLAGGRHRARGGEEIATAGGRSAGHGASPGPAPAADWPERRLQLTRCLREHGADVPDASSGRELMDAMGNVDPDKLQEALGSCQQYLGGGDSQPGLSEDDKQRMLDYVRCLREQGVDIQDPDPRTGLPQGGDVRKFLNPDAEMTRAVAACAQFRPRGMGGGGDG